MHMKSVSKNSCMVTEPSTGEWFESTAEKVDNHGCPRMLSVANFEP